MVALAISWERERDRLLELEARRRLVDRIRAYPGLHLAALARDTGLEPNRAKYHLDRLERCDLVTSRREEGFLLYFPKEEGSLGLRETVAAPEKAVLALLRRPVPLQVTLALLDRDEATHSQLTELVPVAHGTLHYHLQKMEAKGLLASEKVGRERRYRLVERDRIDAMLLRYRPPDKLVQGFLEAWEAFEA